MTTEELLKAFPECEKIRVENIEACIVEALHKERFYREAKRAITRRAEELWPYNWRAERDDPDRVAYEAYFWGNSMKDIKAPFAEWIKTFETAFIARHGQIRSFEEACQTAADEWTHMVFGNHMQDNGDQSDTGGLAMMLGTLVKDKAKRDIDGETIEKFRTLCKDYYLGHCLYEGEYGMRVWEPYCDYHPNTPLADLLLKAGVPKDKAEDIAPWKTGIGIDKRDNSVIVRGYQKERYI